MSKFYFRSTVAFGVTETGTVYMWGNQNPSKEFSFEKEISFLLATPILLRGYVFQKSFFIVVLDLSKIKIKSVGCNNNVSIFLSTHGDLYSWGIDVFRSGILGLGKIFRQNTPKRISSLNSYK